MIISEMTLKEVEARLAELDEVVTRAETVEEVETASSEKAELLTRKAELAEIEKRTALAAELSSGEAKEEKILEERKNIEKEVKTMFNRESPEYRSAFLAMLVGRETAEQRGIFADNTNYGDGIALPVTIDQQIWDQVCSEHPILADVTTIRSGIVMKVPQITPTVPAGKKDSASSSELTYTTAEVTLAGKDYHTYITLSYAEALMSMDALEKYIVAEVATVLSESLAKDVFARILTDAGTAPITKGSGNTWFECLKTALASASLAAAPVVYAPASLYYNVIGEVDTNGQPIFRNGLVLNVPIKLDNAATKVTIVEPKKFVLNVAKDIMVESEKDVKAAAYNIGGYCRAEGCMRVKKAASYVG